MKRSVVYAACVAIIVAMPLSGYAQQPSRDKSPQKSAMPDEKFVKKVAQDGKAEVELGKLATQRASSDSVKQFGQRMVTDHSKAGDELVQLAQQKGVMLPADVNAKHKKTHDRLSKLSGAGFDLEYMKLMAREHDAEVKLFQRESERAKDPDVKAWTSKTLPVLQEHQRQAHQIEDSLKGAKSAKSRDKAGAASPGTGSAR